MTFLSHFYCIVERVGSLCMSAPVALADDVERGSLPSSGKFTLDTLSLHEEKLLSVYGDGPGFRYGEFVLPCGESYVGTFLVNAPHGRGKYVWSDGCVYDGEWRMGMKHGSGKMTWASGSLYEGEFSGGYMHGSGKFIGLEGSYDGRWKLSRKHGLGFQTYPNGDVFEGSWIQGAIEGPGKYTWANGNTYIGHMKGGKMSGKGTLTWSNGDSYEGSWAESMVHGFGVYTWAEGDSYVGTWTRGLKDGKGVFYPKGCKPPVAEEFYLNALKKRGYSPDVKRQSHGSRSRILHFSSVEMGIMKANETQGPGTSSSWNANRSPTKLNHSRSNNISLERGWSLEVAFEKILGLGPSVSGEATLPSDKPVELNFPILEREYVQGVLISEVVINDCLSSSSRRIRRRQKKLARGKKQGVAIIKGHRSYDLMLSLQLGIRYFLLSLLVFFFIPYLHQMLQFFRNNFGLFTF